MEKPHTPPRATTLSHPRRLPLMSFKTTKGIMVEFKLLARSPSPPPFATVFQVGHRQSRLATEVSLPLLELDMLKRNLIPSWNYCQRNGCTPHLSTCPWSTRNDGHGPSWII